MSQSISTRFTRTFVWVVNFHLLCRWRKQKTLQTSHLTKRVDTAIFNLTLLHPFLPRQMLNWKENSERRMRIMETSRCKMIWRRHREITIVGYDKYLDLLNFNIKFLSFIFFCSDIISIDFNFSSSFPVYFFLPVRGGLCCKKIEASERVGGKTLVL